jgi:hypothetical protein
MIVPAVALAAAGRDGCPGGGWRLACVGGTLAFSMQ